MFGIKIKLKKIKKDSSPSQAFKSSLHMQLKKEMENKYMVNTSIIARYAVVGITSMALVFSAGTGVYAYESPEVVDGHPLEFVKESIEGVEERIATIRKRKAEYHTKMLRRRLAEAETHNKVPDKTNRLLSAAAIELGMTMQDLRENIHNEETQQVLVDKLTIVNEKYGHLLDRYIDYIHEEETDHLRRRARLHQAGLGEELLKIREQIKDSDITDEEKRATFKKMMHELINDYKEKAQTMREELEESGASLDEIKKHIRVEFHPAYEAIDQQINKLNPEALHSRFITEFANELEQDYKLSSEQMRGHLRAEMRRKFYEANKSQIENKEPEGEFNDDEFILPIFESEVQVISDRLNNLNSIELRKEYKKELMDEFGHDDDLTDDQMRGHLMSELKRRFYENNKDQIENDVPEGDFYIDHSESLPMFNPDIEFPYHDNDVDQLNLIDLQKEHGDEFNDHVINDEHLLHDKTEMDLKEELKLEFNNYDLNDVEYIEEIIDHNDEFIDDEMQGDVEEVEDIREIEGVTNTM